MYRKSNYLCSPFCIKAVKELKKYDIDIYGLEEKSYDYDFESDSTFFAEMNQELIEEGQFKTSLVLDKSATMIQLFFTITGRLGLVCDRSLEAFEEPIAIKSRHILKFGDHNEELTDEIEIIHRNTTRINVAQYIFDLIALSLPMKRLHPRYRTEEATDQEEVLIYSTTTNTDEALDDHPKEANPDPRWDVLKKLKS